MTSLAFILLQTMPATTQAAGIALVDVIAPAATTAPDSHHALFDFYALNLRASLFAGFLTLGSFLTATNTFIIVNLKDKLYENEEYRKKALQRRALRRANGGTGRAVTFYGPLRKLSTLLLITICCALGTAIAQLSIGLIRANWAAIVCLVLPALTMILVAFVLWVIKCNLGDWFEHLETSAVAKEEADLKAALELAAQKAKAATPAPETAPPAT